MSNNTTNIGIHIVSPQDFRPKRPFGFPDALFSALNPGGSGYYALQSYQEEYPGRDDYPYLLLNKDGCRMLDGSNNCTQACLDPGMVWNAYDSMYTMQNCMVYPAISSLLSTSNMLNESAVQTAKDYAILGLDSINVTSIISTISGCLEQYCDGNPCGDLPPGNSSYAVDIPTYKGLDSGIVPILSERLGDIHTFFRSNYCVSPSIYTTPSDLAGPGVFVSYLIQISICLLLYFLYKALNSWIRNVIFWGPPLPPFGPIFWHLLPGKSLKYGFEEARSAQAKFRNSEQMAALKSTIVEFHKAQCFFNLAIQAGALLAIYSKSNYLQASTYQELQNNTQLLQTIAVLGFFPPVFIQYLLQVAGMGSGYTFALCLGSVILSSRTYSATQKFPFSPDMLKIPVQYLDKCGNTPPIQYCYYNADELQVVNYEIGGPSWEGTDFLDRVFPDHMSMLAFCYVVLILLFLNLWEVFPLSFGRLRDLTKFWRRQPGNTVYRHDNILTLVNRHITSWHSSHIYDATMTRLGPTPYFLGIATVEQGIDTLVWAFLVVFDILFIQGFARIYGELGSYINPYSYGVTQIDWGAWTFGQILGVTIWAPVVVEWLYVSIWGIERASRYRISRPFRVIKDQGDEIVIDPLPSYSKLRRAESDTDYMLDSSSKSTFHRTNSSLPDSLSQKGAIKTSLSPEIIVEEPSGAVVRDK